MVYNAYSLSESELSARRLQTFSALALSVTAFAGALFAAFIFVCDMKSMDGPQGAQNEGPVILVLTLLAPYLTGLLWWCLRPSSDPYGYSPGFGMKYGTVAGVVSYFVVAAIVGISMGAVTWGSSEIHLQVWSLAAALAAGLVAGLGAINYLGAKREDEARK